jgi:uncharacterized protein (DUF1684 family)
MTDKNYIESVIQRRTQREKRLVATPRNWFSLAGLFPLNQGENNIGGDSDRAIVLSGLKTSLLAVVEMSGNQVVIHVKSQELSINGETETARKLNSDHDEKPDIISVGSNQIMLIQRGEKFFLRVWDTQSERAKNFRGLNYFAIDEKWRIDADFQLFSEPRILPIEDVIGTKYDVKYIGKANFKLSNIQCSLIAEEEEDGLFFSFKDLTSLDSTYPAGRYMLTEPVKNGQVTLDFNLSVNWPCAYTPYATCPLPPFENHLKVRIEAGEKKYPEPKA